ncbi:MAG TPA: hypothetical protein VFC85_06735, partial [Verrucomicrobiae bacterium]|nr:hypothetical protein [Verrucomicrobiae bacterium]
MQNSKSLAATGLIVLASLISLQAQDNPAQAAARGALIQEMNGSSETAPPASTMPATNASDEMNAQTNEANSS